MSFFSFEMITNVRFCLSYTVYDFKLYLMAVEFETVFKSRHSFVTYGVMTLRASNQVF